MPRQFFSPWPCKASFAVLRTRKLLYLQLVYLKPPFLFGTSELSMFIFPPLFFISGWRCNKHHSRPNIHIHFSFRRQWCSHCTRYIAVSVMLYVDSTTSRAFSGYCFYIYFLFCRYLIALILFWRLMGQVDLLPPSIKHLQFSRFLKNGKRFV